MIHRGRRLRQVRRGAQWLLEPPPRDSDDREDCTVLSELQAFLRSSFLPPHRTGAESAPSTATPPAETVFSLNALLLASRFYKLKAFFQRNNLRHVS